MPSLTLRLSSLRPPWWKRPGALGAIATGLCVTPLLLAAWLALAPQNRLPEGDAPGAPPILTLRDFDRNGLNPEAFAMIARGNVLSGTRSEFTRMEEAAVAQAPAPDRGASEAAKRLENAKRDLATLRLVAVLRVGGEWIALFEPERRAAHEDLLSLRVGNVWQNWSVGAITRDTVRMGFEGHSETIQLRPNTGRTTRAATPTPPRGRIQAESRPVDGAPVRVDPPISRSDARRLLLDSVSGESARVRALTEELLKSLDRDNDR